MAFLTQRDRPLLVTPSHIPDSRLGKATKNGRNEKQGRSRDSREGSGDNPRKRRKSRGETLPGMVTYRLDVGKNDGAEPRHIVGAIANEAGVESQYIQNIDINPDHTTVDLPEGMPKEIEKHLKSVRVMGQKLQLRHFTGGKSHDREKQKNKASKKKSTKE